MNAITKKVLFQLIAVAGVAAGSIGTASADYWHPEGVRDFHVDRVGRVDRGERFDRGFDRRFDRGLGRSDGRLNERHEGFRGPAEHFREPLVGAKR